MIDSLQDYLKMEQTLKALPEGYMRLIEEEKARFEEMFKAIKGVNNKFSKNCLKKAVEEVFEAHKNDTDSDIDTNSDAGFLKSSKN